MGHHADLVVHEREEMNTQNKLKKVREVIALLKYLESVLENEIKSEPLKWNNQYEKYSVNQALNQKVCYNEQYRQVPFPWN